MFNGSWVMQRAVLRKVYFKMMEVERKDEVEKKD